MAGKSKSIDISQDSNYVLPKSIQGLDNGELQAYYQYYFANEKDSPLSIKIDTLLTDSEKNILLNSLYGVIALSNTKLLFNSILHNPAPYATIQSLKLNDNNFVVDEIKGFFHKKNTEHELDCILRHTRNSFAHGRVAFENNYIILEDKVNQLTARFVVTIEMLEKWKNEILQYMKSKGVII